MVRSFVTANFTKQSLINDSSDKYNKGLIKV